MCPKLSPDNQMNQSLADAKFFSEFVNVPRPSVFVEAANFKNNFFGKFILTMALSTPYLFWMPSPKVRFASRDSLRMSMPAAFFSAGRILTALFQTVLLVVSVRSLKQMGRVNTNCIVTGVADKEGGPIAAIKEKCYAVGTETSSIARAAAFRTDVPWHFSLSMFQAESPIAAGKPGACPLPATGRHFAYFVLESLDILWCKVRGVTINISHDVTSETGCVVVRLVHC